MTRGKIGSSHHSTHHGLDLFDFCKIREAVFGGAGDGWREWRVRHQMGRTTDSHVEVDTRRIKNLKEDKKRSLEFGDPSSDPRSKHQASPS
jgi:hypothetical protein